MKNIKIALLFPLLLTLLGCNKSGSLFVNNTLFIASDLHYLSNSLTGNIYKKEYLTTDGRTQELDDFLIDSLIEKVNRDKPNYLFLTGDLTFNGEKKSHEDLISKLNQVNNTKVLVIPGNHDIENQYSSTFVNDKSEYTASITEDEFKIIYSNYGYSDAFEYDSDSLSYSYILDNSTMALMLDTTMCRFNDMMGYNHVGGYISEVTFDFIKRNLEYAKTNNINVISFSHHNLLLHNSKFDNLYRIYESEKIVELYKEYDVKLHFSGHLHIQNIASNDSLTDICSSSLLDFPVNIGKLSIDRKSYKYNAISLVKNTDNYQKMYDTFYSRYYDKSITSSEKSYGENAKKVTDFKANCNTLYFAGYYKELQKYIKENKEASTLIESNSENEGYIIEVMGVEDKDQTNLTIKK